MKFLGNTGNQYEWKNLDSKEDTVLSERKDCAPKVKERFVNWILKAAFKRNSNNVKDERMRVQQVDLQVVLVLCSLELQKLPYRRGHILLHGKIARTRWILTLSVNFLL